MRSPAPGFTSENDELESVFGTIIGATGRKGIFIYDSWESGGFGSENVEGRDYKA